MAVRNGERYLEALLDSLAGQKRPPHELVVSDDASEDTTPALLEAFAARAPFPVRVERADVHGGHVDAFVRAARRCDGDAIAFCDADDVWREDKLEVCARELERTGATLVLHTTRVVDEGLGDAGLSWPDVGTTRLVPPLGLTALDVHAPGMAMVFDRRLLDAADFLSRPHSRYDPERQMLHDEWVLFLAGVLGPIRLVAEPLVLYRQHGANDSGGPVLDRRRMTLRPALDDYRRAAAHTLACAEYLERTPATDDTAAARLAAGARHYRRAASNWGLRAGLYEAPGRRPRARALTRLVGARAYGRRASGGFGRAALGKDLAGVALPRALGDRASRAR